jgi:hypothetical protein
LLALSAMLINFSLDRYRDLQEQEKAIAQPSAFENRLEASHNQIIKKKSNPPSEKVERIWSKKIRSTFLFGRFQSPIGTILKYQFKAKATSKRTDSDLNNFLIKNHLS